MPPCRSCCGSRNCRLSSGSWPTSCAARSGRDGAARGPPERADGLGRFVESTPTGTYLQLSGWAEVKRTTAGVQNASWSTARVGRSAPRSSFATCARRRGASVTRRAARSPPAWTRPPSAPDRRLARCRAPRAPRRDPRRPRDRAGRPARRPPHRRGLAARPGDPGRPDPDHRPPPAGGGAVGRPPLEVAPVRQQGAPGRRGGRGRGRRGARRVLPDLCRDGPASGLRPSRPVGLRRRLRRVRRDRSGPAPACPAGRRDPGGGAPPADLRWSGRRAVRRDDRGRRGVPCELPAQVGGDPQLARARLHDVRHVGRRPSRDRALQVRLRWAGGPLRRRPDARPRSGRPHRGRARAAGRGGRSRARHGIRGGGAAGTSAAGAGGDAT